MITIQIMHLAGAAHESQPEARRTAQPKKTTGQEAGTNTTREIENNLSSLTSTTYNMLQEPLIS